MYSCEAGLQSFRETSKDNPNIKIISNCRKIVLILMIQEHLTKALSMTVAPHPASSVKIYERRRLI